MIGNIFSKFFELLINLFLGIGSFLKDVADAMLSFLFTAFKWLGELLARLFQSLIDVLVSFFQVVYDLIRGILYFIYVIGLCVAKFFAILWEVAKLAWAFVQGISSTLSSIFFVPTTPDLTMGAGHGYSGIIGKIMSYTDVLQLDVIAYILLFGVWLFGAFGVVQILGSLRGSGD